MRLNMRLGDVTKKSGRKAEMITITKLGSGGPPSELVAFATELSDLVESSLVGAPSWLAATLMHMAVTNVELDANFSTFPQNRCKHGEPGESGE